MRIDLYHCFITVKYHAVHPTEWVKVYDVHVASFDAIWNDESHGVPVNAHTWLHAISHFIVYVAVVRGYSHQPWAVGVVVVYTLIDVGAWLFAISVFILNLNFTHTV